MTIETATRYLASMAATLEQLEALPVMARMNTIRMTAFLLIVDPRLRAKAINACLDGGLLTVPLTIFTKRVHSTIQEVIDGPR